jgi:hypothetical protein
MGHSGDEGKMAQGKPNPGSGPTHLTQSFNALLNSHGYAFQYAVLDVIKRLHQDGKSKWQFEVSEFPVCVQGQGTRIDFILKHAMGYYLIAECKRSDPKFANWCFVRAPSVKRDQGVEMLWVDQVETSSIVTGVQGVGLRRRLDEEAYHIGFPLKSRERDGESAKSRNAIEDAAGQVCRGLNGLIELLLSRPRDLVRTRIFLLPIIFTTAKLWVSKCDLASANIEDGNMKIPERDLMEVPWVYYQYHVSPGLKHSCHLIQKPSQLADALSAYYVRTIPIVNALGIESFLTALDPTCF